jgi:hypothetical protein
MSDMDEDEELVVGDDDDEYYNDGDDDDDDDDDDDENAEDGLRQSQQSDPFDADLRQSQDGISRGT